MEILRRSKKIVVLVLVFVFVVGIGVFIYLKNNDDEVVNIGSFYENNNGNVMKERDGSFGGLNDTDGFNDLNDVENLDGSDSLDNVVNSNNENNESGDIYVHIIGEVKNEGIIGLKEGQRIVDAIEKAGGATDLANLSKVNLAFVLSDGQKVRIPSINDEDVEISNNVGYVSDSSGNNVILEGGNNTNNINYKVNVNTATQTELETLNGIGPSIAARIVEYREKNGKFNHVEDLLNVSGIGETKFEGIKESVIVK